MGNSTTKSKLPVPFCSIGSKATQGPHGMEGRGQDLEEEGQLASRGQGWEGGSGPKAGVCGLPAYMGFTKLSGLWVVGVIGFISYPRSTLFVYFHISCFLRVLLP